MSIKDKLKDMDEQFASAPDSDDVKLPDGVYASVVESVEIGESDKGDVVVIIHVVITGGPHDGRKQQRRHYLDGAEKVAWLKKDLVRMGVDVASMRLSDLPGIVDELAGIAVEVKLLTKGQYQNLYIQRRLGAAEKAAEKKQDDFPF
jgi:hypothetical protein